MKVGELYTVKAMYTPTWQHEQTMYQRYTQSLNPGDVTMILYVGADVCDLLTKHGICYTNIMWLCPWK